MAVAQPGRRAKEYPYNFAGITEAIQDLTIVASGEPGSQIGTKPNTTQPDDGTLWFDTRQGRLFVAFNNEWYQTNGADGLPIVSEGATEPNPGNLPNGQFWWREDINVLYIFEGTFYEADGTITPDPSKGVAPVWIPVVGSSTGQQTTATLPTVPPDAPDPDDLRGTVFNRGMGLNALSVIPQPDNGLQFQYDVNHYFMDCLIALNEEAKETAISIGETAPENPIAGQLWFDIEDIELSIYYDDGVTSQWVPTSASYASASSVTMLGQQIAEEAINRGIAINGLTDDLTALETSHNSLASTVTTLQSQVSEPPDLSNYVLSTSEQSDVKMLQDQISANDGDISAIYASIYTKKYLDNSFKTVEAEIAARVSHAELQAVENKIPNISTYSTIAYVDSQIATVNPVITTAGGSVQGTVTSTKPANVPGIDFSSSIPNGQQALKFKTYNDENNTVTFGTNNNYNEYAWAFDSCEDFCWKHAGSKVTSIDKNGIATKKLYIADFGTNNNYGRSLTNTIDVGSKLTSYQSTFEAIRNAVNASSDFASLKSGLTSALANV